MEIKRSSKRPAKTFGNIIQSGVFEYDDCFYLKIQQRESNDNSVRLTDGYKFHFNTDDPVISYPSAILLLNEPVGAE